MAAYEDILTKVQQYTEDASPDLVAAFPTILQIAEARIDRDLGVTLKHYSEGVEASLAANGYLVTLLTNYDAVRWVQVKVGDVRYFPQQRDISYIRETYPIYGGGVASGFFKYFGFINNTTLHLAPPANLTSTILIGYLVGLVGLAPGTATWLSDNYPELLFMAVLSEAETFHKSPEMKQLYEGEYQALLKTAITTEAARHVTYLTANGVNK